MKVSLLILNYNGKDLLEECLPSIIDAASNSHHDCEVMVVDNQSHDESIDTVRKVFPKAKTHICKENRCLSSFNEVATHCGSDILILMNNDVKAEPDFIDPLIGPFLEEEEDLFMTSPHCLLFDRKTYEGTLSVPRIRWGIFGTEKISPNWEKRYEGSGYTISSGVCLAVDREKFLSLEGYDSLYLPGTLEDLDLCYRAWKRGWRCLYVPESVVYHKSQATFKSVYCDREIRKIVSRNTFLFMWKNITDKIMLARHFACILPRLIYAACKGDISFISGFFSTFSKIGQVWTKRVESAKTFRRSDKEVLQHFIGYRNGRS